MQTVSEIGSYVGERRECRRKRARSVRSAITLEQPGLQEGKWYEFVRYGYFHGSYVEIINDRQEQIAIYYPEHHLHMEDIET